MHCINNISATMLMENIVAQKSCHREWGRSNPETSSTRGQFSNHYITKKFIGALLIMHKGLSVRKDIAIKRDTHIFFLIIGATRANLKGKNLLPLGANSFL